MTTLSLACGMPAGDQFPAVFQFVLKLPFQVTVVPVGLGPSVAVALAVAVSVSVGVAVSVELWAGVKVGGAVAAGVGEIVGVGVPGAPTVKATLKSLLVSLDSNLSLP